MRSGIIGAGGIGRAIARRLATAGIETAISNSRSPESLSDFVRELGPGTTAVPARETATAEIVFVAVTWARMPDALSGLPPWNGRIVIDAMNPIVPPGFTVADLGGRTSSEVVADFVPGARLVKAFNTLPPQILAADPYQAGGRRVIFMSGDDAAAKSEVARLIDRLGFFAIDLGDLVSGGRLHQFPGGPLPALNLIKLT